MLYNLLVYLEDEQARYDTAMIPYQVESVHLEVIYQQMNQLDCECVRIYEYLGHAHIIPKRRILKIEYWEQWSDERVQQELQQMQETAHHLKLTTRAAPFDHGQTEKLITTEDEL